MAEYEESSSSSLPWLISGLVIGAALGLLFAPKGGPELREDISDYFDRARHRSRGFIDRMKEKIPSRVKAAGVAGGVAGAVKGAGGEAYREAKERFSA